MAYTVTATTQVDLTYKAQADDDIAAPIENKSTKADTKTSYAEGAGASQTNQHYRIRRTLSPSSGVLDFNLTQLDNRLNEIAGFSSVKEIMVLNRDPDGGGNLTVGSAPSNGWTIPYQNAAWEVTVGPGGIFYLKSPYDGYAVHTANGTIRLTHDGGSSGDIDFDLIVLGNS